MTLSVAKEILQSGKSYINSLNMFFNRYARLEDEDIMPPENTLQTIRKSSVPSKFALLTVLVGTACTVFGYTVYPYMPYSTFPGEQQLHRQLHCGNSSTEAQHLGCVFDLLTNNWMPKHCSDPITDSEYREWVMAPNRHLGPWAFFLDSAAQHQVKSEEDLSRLVGEPVYTTTENHLAHCTFLARRMHRLTTGEIKAVAHNTFAHTLHCTSAVLDAISAPGPAISKSGIASTFNVSVVSCTI